MHNRAQSQVNGKLQKKHTSREKRLDHIVQKQSNRDE